MGLFLAYSRAVTLPVSFRARSTSGVITEVVIVLAGIGLVALALVTSQDWLDRHLYPSFFVPRRWYVILESSARVAMTAAGLSLALIVRAPIGRIVARRPASVPISIFACVLAVVAAHVVLAWTRPTNKWLVAQIEPLRRADPRLGWTMVPDRSGRKEVGGRTIDFTFDAAGYRVRSAAEPVDPARPTVLFTGESVMAGEGLNWEETIPAQVGELLGLQSANLAVHGYATDQSYLRLEADLPRFRRPAAVVSLFMPALFGRNMDDDRPHLALASGPRIDLDAGRRARTARVAGEAHRAVSPRRHGGARRGADARSAARDCGARQDSRRRAAHHRAAVQSRRQRRAYAAATSVGRRRSAVRVCRVRCGLAFAWRPASECGDGAQDRGGDRGRAAGRASSCYESVTWPPMQVYRTAPKPPEPRNV